MRRLTGVLIVLSGLPMLSECSSITGGSPDDTSSFGTRLTNFFASAKPGVSQPASPTPSAPEIECPGVDIRAGASTLNVMGKPAQAGQSAPGDLRYQLSFGQTARECSVQSGTMTIKVGVQGRLILGPMGGPGQVDVPLRYAVVREGPEPKTIITRFKRIPVAVPPEQTHVPFVDIEDNLSFPTPSNSELESYVIYVGFDEIGDKNEKRPAKAAKRPSQRQ